MRGKVGGNEPFIPEINIAHADPTSFAFTVAAFGRENACAASGGASWEPELSVGLDDSSSSKGICGVESSVVSTCCVLDMVHDAAP